MKARKAAEVRQLAKTRKVAAVPRKAVEASRLAKARTTAVVSRLAKVRKAAEAHVAEACTATEAPHMTREAPRTEVEVPHKAVEVLRMTVAVLRMTVAVLRKAVEGSRKAVEVLRMAAVGKKNSVGACDLRTAFCSLKAASLTTGIEGPSEPPRTFLPQRHASLGLLPLVRER